MACRLPLGAIDIYYNDYDSAILEVCKLIACEARPFFQEDHDLTFTYYANNAKALGTEMMVPYYRWLSRIGHVLLALCRKPSQGVDARAWDWLLRPSQQIGHRDLSAMDPFFRKGLKLVRKTRTIQYRFELMFEPRFSLVFDHDMVHLLASIGFRLNGPESGLYISVKLKLSHGPYMFLERSIAHTSLTHASTQGIWSIEPLD
jgi:hypothetical protein